MDSRRITELLKGLPPEPTPQASHQAARIPLILAILPILVNRQINLFRQWRPATHPHVHLLQLAVTGQRLQPVDLVAIHDPWLGVELSRGGQMWGGLDSGDLLMSCGGSPCLRFGDSSHTSGMIRAVTTEVHRK